MDSSAVSSLGVIPRFYQTDEARGRVSIPRGPGSLRSHCGGQLTQMGPSTRSPYFFIFL